MSRLHGIHSAPGSGARRAALRTATRSDLMSIDWRLLGGIAKPIVLLVAGGSISRWMERRPRLITYYGHVSAHEVKGNEKGQTPLMIFTHDVIVRNVGRKAATNVKMGHRTLPNFNVYPDVSHTVVDLP